MTNDEIKELIRLVVDSGIAELELQRGEDRVRIRRTLERQEMAMPVAMAPSVPATAVDAVPTSAPQPPPPQAKEYTQKSPIVGTYYECPKPGDPAFVKVGDVVELGQILCIIESMKLMNEIECEAAGTVVAKLVENGRPVEYGEALLT